MNKLNIEGEKPMDKLASDAMKKALDIVIKIDKSISNPRFEVMVFKLHEDPEIAIKDTILNRVVLTYRLNGNEMKIMESERGHDYSTCRVINGFIGMLKPFKYESSKYLRLPYEKKPDTRRRGLGDE